MTAKVSVSRAPLTPERLFAYAIGYTKSAYAADLASMHPTFRQAARHFKVSLDAIEQACEDWHGSGYMRAAVGFRAGGGGIGEYKSRGDWLVEAYE